MHIGIYELFAYHLIVHWEELVEIEAIFVLHLLHVLTDVLLLIPLFFLLLPALPCR